MLIDCDSCTARPRACGDCIVTHLLQVGRADRAPGGPHPDRPGPVGGPGERDDEHGAPAVLTDSEVAAVAVLSAGGLVPPLRLVTPDGPPRHAGRTRGRSRAG